MAAPNILLIQVDQMAASALSAYGNKTVKDPHIRRLANEGIVFENCYCNFPICGPSRASMHAMRMPFAIDMFDNASEFAADIPTFCHYLRHMGYRTELSGKMHFVGPDQFHGYEKRHTTEIYPANFAWTVDWSKGREFRPTNLTMSPVLESGPAIRTLQMDYDDEVGFAGVQALYDLVRKSDDRPFHLTISFTSPHSPFVIGHRYWALYDHDHIELPTVPPLDLDEMDHLSRNLHYCQARHRFTVTDEHVRMARHGYYGMISYIDEKIGQIMSVIRETGLAENTIVVFTSDHGEMLGERGMWFKQHFFDPAARVPLIFWCPPRFASAQVSKSVSLIDIGPTILDLAAEGTFNDYAAPCDGTSLVDALYDGEDDLPDIALSEFSADGSTGPSRMIRSGRYKLMLLEDQDVLLYDLISDPYEEQNLSERQEFTDEVARLTSLLSEPWDYPKMYERIRESQRRRIAIHKATGGDPTYVNMVRYDDDRRYVRNSGAADTKAKARFPFVPSAKPDQR